MDYYQFLAVDCIDRENNKYTIRKSVRYQWTRNAKFREFLRFLAIWQPLADWIWIRINGKIQSEDGANEQLSNSLSLSGSTGRAAAAMRDMVAHAASPREPFG